MNKVISIVIPLYNEEETLPVLYDRLTQSLNTDFFFCNYQIIFVNDGSTDKTYSILQEYAYSDTGVTVINFSRNFGHMVAITAGLDYAMGDYVVMMDGDLQDQPEDLIVMYKKLQEGYDVVYSQRLEKQFSWWKKYSSRAFLWVLKWILNEQVEMSTTVFRMMRKKVVDQVVKLREGQRYVIGIIGWVGFKHTSVPLKHAAREYGETKYSFLQQIALAIDTICSFSTYPLKLITRLGFLCMLGSFVFSFYIIFQYFYYASPVPGWASLILAIIFIGGLQVFSIGILGEYLGRSYMEIKQRPLYVVDQVINGPERRDKFYKEKKRKWW